MRGLASFLAMAIWSAFFMAASGPDVRRYAFDSDTASVYIDSDAVKLGLELSCVSTSRSHFRSNHPLRWSLSWNHGADSYDFIRIYESRYNLGESYYAVVGSSSYGTEMIVDSVCVNRPIARYPDATWTYLYWADGRLDVYCGTTELKKIMSVANSVPDREFRLYGAGVSFDSVVMEIWKDMSHRLMSDYTEELIREKATLTGGSVEGIWEYFDRDTDEEMARLGGRYRLGIIREDDGSFSIIYLGGAVVNKHKWDSGMIKGRLVATPFKGQYTLQWYDSSMEMLDVDVDSYATLVNPSLMNLVFPLYKTSFRLVRAN